VGKRIYFVGGNKSEKKTFVILYSKCNNRETRYFTQPQTQTSKYVQGDIYPQYLSSRMPVVTNFPSSVELFSSHLHSEHFTCMPTMKYEVNINIFIAIFN